MIDQKIIELTSMFGALGCLGIIFGYMFSFNKINKLERKFLYTQHPQFKTLSVFNFFILLVVGIFFSEISSTLNLFLKLLMLWNIKYIVRNRF